MAERMTLFLLFELLRRAPSAMPSTARLLDSVPPDVITTSPGRNPQPMEVAIVLLATSSSRAASRPSEWSELGLASEPGFSW